METKILTTVGLGMALVGTAFLVRFGVSFHGDTPGVSTGKDWKKLWLTVEQGQRVGFVLLTIGFGLQLAAQFS